MRYDTGAHDIYQLLFSGGTDGVTFDSRAVAKGDLFFALSGETTDGHGFVAEAMKRAPELGKDKIIIVNLSGRGDKDCVEVARLRGQKL